MVTDFELRFLSQIAYDDLSQSYVDKFGPGHLVDLTTSVPITTLIEPSSYFWSLYQRNSGFTSMIERLADWNLVTSMRGLWLHQKHASTLVQNNVPNVELDAFVFRNKANDVVISFRGTNFIERKQFKQDMKENLKIIYMRSTDTQIFQSLGFTNLIITNRERLQFEQLYLTGHSKGGGLVQKIISYYSHGASHVKFNNAIGVTFSAPPIFFEAMVTQEAKDNYACTNYVNKRDRVLFILYCLCFWVWGKQVMVRADEQNVKTPKWLMWWRFFIKRKQTYPIIYVGRKIVVNYKSFWHPLQMFQKSVLTRHSLCLYDPFFYACWANSETQGNLKYAHSWCAAPI